MPTGLPGLPSDGLAGYHFSIEIDSVSIAQFQEVSGIVSEIEVIPLKENNKDGKFIIKQLPGNFKPPTITFKRAKNSSTDMWDWHQKAVEGKMSDARKNGSVVLYSYDHAEVSRYNFVNAWPSKVTMSGLKAGGNEVLVEEVTIVCEELHRVK
jgi:phage tail-like protein